MFECHVCGNTTARDDRVSEVFTVVDRVAMVEQVPARVCERCGEAVFSPETAERIRLMIHSDSHPIRTVPLDVFSLA